MSNDDTNFNYSLLITNYSLKRAAYGFSAKLTEAEVVGELMKQLEMRN